MTTDQRAVIHRSIERLAAAKQDIEVEMRELQELLDEDSRKAAA